MRIVNKEELELYEDELHEQLHNGGLFVHPTDTIYGLGCDATNPKAVEQIRIAKNRPARAFSIIAPSVEWILENCDVTPRDLSELPGAVTLIVPLKNQDAVASNVIEQGSIGVRIPNHWISSAVERFGKPIITTSVNVSGEPHVKNLEEIPTQIKGKVSFAIDEGEKIGRPSKIIDLIKRQTRER